MKQNNISCVAIENVRVKKPDSGFTLLIDEIKFTNERVNVIAGHNGSGKTTLLRIMALLDSPDSGSVLLNGNAIAGKLNGSYRRRIGYLTQKPYLFDMSVFDNIALGLRIRGVFDTSRVREMTDALGISHLAGRRIKGLSAGEYQKTAIAQTLIFRPEMLLMDEPCANVDEQSIPLIENAISNLCANNNTLVILTTHSMEQAYRFSSDITVLSDGKLAGFSHENIFKINSVKVI